jgi:hypothetical protein
MCPQPCALTTWLRLSVSPRPRGRPAIACGRCASGALHRIGRIIGGRWAISQVALDMLLDGEKEGLEAYRSGDRTSERVRSYYTRRSIPIKSVSAGSADYADR